MSDSMYLYQSLSLSSYSVSLFIFLVLIPKGEFTFYTWMCFADDSSKVKGVKAVFIRISSKVNSEQSRAWLYFWWKWKDDSFVVGGSDKSRLVLNCVHPVPSKQPTHYFAI